MTSQPRKVRAPDLVLWKARGERIVMLTAYDATWLLVLAIFVGRGFRSWGTSG